MKLQGKRAIVTGASQGLGLATAAAFIREGASVLICARDSNELEKARASLASQAKDGQSVYAMAADISSETDVEKLAAIASKHWDAVDILVCNAGVYGPKGSIEDIEWSQWVQAIQINLCGTVLCCRTFLPHLKRAGRGKILLISGGGATKPLPFLSAYAASKAAVVRFGETLAEELRSSGIDVNSIAPGALNTRLLDEILEAGPEKVGKQFYEASLKQKESGGTSLGKGADLAVFLGSNESDGVTGKLIAAVWDPWQEFPEHQQDLVSTDVYTLRRIIPSERGMKWG